MSGWTPKEPDVEIPKPLAIRQQTRGDSMAYAMSRAVYECSEPELSYTPSDMSRLTTAQRAEPERPAYTKGDMIYLACPYTSPCELTQADRVGASADAARWLLVQGCMVFSPITHSFLIDQSERTIRHEQWMRLDRWFLERCSELVILTIDGWEQSRGVQEERRIARERGIPESFLFVDGESYRWERSNAHTA